jgi:hypothetical protein
MPITLEGTVGGRSLEARGEARGEARASRSLLAALLRRTFGSDPRLDDVTARLAELPHAEAVDAVLSAASLDELTAAHPRTPATGTPDENA